MARIKIEDLPESKEISDTDMKKILGGTDLTYARTYSYPTMTTTTYTRTATIQPTTTALSPYPTRTLIAPTDTSTVFGSGCDTGGCGTAGIRG